MYFAKRNSKKTDSLCVKDIEKIGAKIFKSIQSKVSSVTYAIIEIYHEWRNIGNILFKKLETIGYKGLAFGYFQDDVQVVYTENCAACVTTKVIEYIRAVIIAALLVSHIPVICNTKNDYHYL